MGFAGAKVDLDTITNIVTIIVAVAFIALVIQRYVVPSAPTSKEPQVGRSVTLSDFEPSAHNKNVLLVLMKGCRFCEASMGFYKTLLEQNRGTGVKFVVVFPRDSKDIDAYLRTYGITDIDVKYSELSEIDVDATPTIIVTDENGLITKAWVGKLSSEKEKEVSNFLDS